MGRLLALMGPPGSGKMVLLNVLAGQLTASPSLHLSGYLYVNGQPMSQPMSQGLLMSGKNTFSFHDQRCGIRSRLLWNSSFLTRCLLRGRRSMFLLRLGLVNSADLIKATKQDGLQKVASKD